MIQDVVKRTVTVGAPQDTQSPVTPLDWRTPITSAPTRLLRAVEVIRVSKVGKRAKTPEKFVSPDDQKKMIAGVCAQQGGWPIVASFTELNQSGLRTLLLKRKGLYPALQMIENGEADVVVFAFRDRMARNNVVETEFLARVGIAGGKVWAADFGEIRTETAVEKLTSGVLGLVAQFLAEQTREKTFPAKERAVRLGIAPFPILPVGYRRHCDLPQNEGSTDRRSAVYEPERALVVGAYEMRAAGAMLEEIRDWLRSQGHYIQIRGVQQILRNRFYLGELRFGIKLVNIHAHEAIIDKALFDSVQKMRVARGPRRGDSRFSARLLARQGIVYCAYCNRAMIVGCQTQQRRDGVKKYYDYRCPSMGDCTSRVAIQADILEAEVEGWMQEVRKQGRASMGERVAEAQAAVSVAERDLNLAIVNLAIVKDMPQAQETLAVLRTAYEQAQTELQNLQSALGSAMTVSFADWDTASLERKRRLIRIAIKRIVVSRGKGPERIQIESLL
jgi:DNA invertase Pin-like site-specific DNA recombinase